MRIAQYLLLFFCFAWLPDTFTLLPSGVITIRTAGVGRAREAVARRIVGLQLAPLPGAWVGGGPEGTPGFAGARPPIPPLMPMGETAQPAEDAIQPLFLGDRTCGDDDYSCSFLDLVPLHRYLHVLVQGQPGSADWEVQVGATCASATTFAGGEPIEPNGYLEGVVDLEAIGVSPGCIILRGRNGNAATFYAAYLDDTATTDAGQVYPGYTQMGGRPDLPDLDVQYIERRPRYPFDAPKNAPVPGERVVFVAHVANAGGLETGSFSYAWSLDGHRVATGIFPGSLGPGASTVLRFPWRWQPSPHDLSLFVRAISPGSSPAGPEHGSGDPEGAPRGSLSDAPLTEGRATGIKGAGPEITRANNDLTIRTNALTLGIWVESSEYRYFQDNQWLYCEAVSCRGSDSFADWLQRQVRAWNGILQSSVSPIAPAGAADRVRVDEITVVPDGALPLHGGLPTNDPDRTDHTVDLEWGLPSRNTPTEFGFSPVSSFDLDWPLIHELNHARGLADLYRFDVSATSRQISVVDTTGKPIFDPAEPYAPESKLRAFPDPPNPPFLYEDLERDLMACPCSPYYSPYSVMTLNRIQGRRARCGNTNPPCNLGDWFLEIPPLNRLRIMDRAGRPIADGTPIRLYTDTSTGYATHAFDESHRTTLLSRGGIVTLPRDPFGAHGSAWVAGHNLLLLEVADASDSFCFLEPTTFNIAYWDGYRTRSRPALFTMRLGRQFQNGCNLNEPPAIVNEPFSTSPYDSTVRLAKSARGWEVAIHLVDGTRPRHPMGNRLVRVLGRGGTKLGSAVTNDQGTALVRLRRYARFRAVDVTDNDLLLMPST